MLNSLNEMCRVVPYPPTNKFQMLPQIFMWMKKIFTMTQNYSLTQFYT